jgi:hypothetical protein
MARNRSRQAARLPAGRNSGRTRPMMVIVAVHQNGEEPRYDTGDEQLADVLLVVAGRRSCRRHSALGADGCKGE